MQNWWWFTQRRGRAIKLVPKVHDTLLALAEDAAHGLYLMSTLFNSHMIGAPHGADFNLTSLISFCWGGWRRLVTLAVSRRISKEDDIFDRIDPVSVNKSSCQAKGQLNVCPTCAARRCGRELTGWSTQPALRILPHTTSETPQPYQCSVTFLVCKKLLTGIHQEDGPRHDIIT